VKAVHGSSRDVMDRPINFALRPARYLAFLFCQLSWRRSRSRSALCIDFIPHCTFSLIDVLDLLVKDPANMIAVA